jgi:hypothetical protein
MKKKLVVIFALFFLILPVKGLFSQTGAQAALQGMEPKSLPSQLTLAEYIEAQRPSVLNPAVSGQNIFYTHPEFNGIMTTNVTTAAQNTDDGYIFVGPLGQYYFGPSAIMILDDAGQPIYIQTIQDDLFVGDFKKQTVNGSDYLTYHVGMLPGGYSAGTNYVLDDSYQLVDTWTINNGNADLHEFLLLDNGHAILISYDPIPFDLTPYGGPANGTLVEIILQEQDAARNVVFEWRGTEHMPIGDTEMDLNTTDPIDFLHTNAIEIDDDGNWLLSHRNFSEVTKIDRQTGEIIWRLGGQGNEFTFTNDIGFSNQHDIRRMANGNITLYDNGNAHTPPHSRAIEYAIDETAKTVTKVWLYPDDTSEYAFAMGNSQRLPNGNTMIGWGTVPKLTEVLPNGTVALEMMLGSINYRAFRFPWSAAPAQAPRTAIQYGADPTAVTLYTSWNGATDITGYDVYAGTTMGSMSVVDTMVRDGFETEIDLSGLPADTCFFQTKPVHAQADPTPFSNMSFRVDLQVCRDQLNLAFMPVFPK